MEKIKTYIQGKCEKCCANKIQSEKIRQIDIILSKSIK